MILVINELSYSQVQSAEQAKKLYDTFFGIPESIEDEFKTKVSLKYAYSPANNLMHADLPFSKWMGNLEIDKRRSIISMLTSQLIIHDYPYYKAHGSEGKGIGFAYENDELLISFNSDAKWLLHELPIVRDQVGENDEIETDSLIVKNIYDETSCNHYNQIIKDIVQELQNDIYKKILKGTDLWETRTQIFPSLIFCDQTEDYIKGQGGQTLKNLLNRLIGFEKYFSNWQIGDFDIKAVSGDARLESDTRINEFKNELIIKCPDEETRLFAYHCNYGIDGHRMHFKPDATERKCYIGYIGKKIV